MKIYELAKQIGVKAGDLAKAAKEMGIEKAGNFTQLSDDQAAGLAKAFQPKVEVPEEIVPKAPAPRPVFKKGVPLQSVSHDEDRRRLAGGRSRALANFRGRSHGIKPFTPFPVTLRKPIPVAVPEVKPEPVAPVEVPAAPAEAAVKPAAFEEPAATSVAVEKPAPVQAAPAAEKISDAVESKPSQSAPAAPERPVEIDLGGFGQLQGGSQGDGPRVIFHPAAVDDYDDDDDDRGRRDDDDESDEDLQREYFGRRGASSQQMKHRRDDFREEGERDGRRGTHGQQQGRGAPQGRGPQQPVRGQQPAPRGGARPGQQQAAPQARPGAPSVFPARPGAQSVFPTRPGAQSVFPTRPGAQSVFPTRPQAPSVFPTRAGQQSVFPTRPQAPSVFPTRAGQQSVFPTRQGMAQGRQQGPQGQARGQQAMGKNQRGQQPMNKNQRGQQQPPNGKLPVAPPVPAPNAPIAGDHVISLRGPTLIRELAEMMGVRPNRLIADLMQEKVLVSINQRVDLEMAGKIADKYGYRVELERARRSTERKPEIKRLDEDDEIPEDKPEDMKPRPPVVTFLGHVDHGKTSLLDYIRKAHVAAGEAGGITQHIGAYSVDINDRKITFLDTPGHAAFSAMRARGAKLTDIAVIVVAADDGIMPQTREVIKQCRQVGVQMMVAINKCDLPSAKPDRVRQQLQGEGLTPEDWGGDIVCCEVSAHTGAGMDNLLEMILLQADVLELQANPNRRADGYIIEAQMERGIGPTATLLVASGTLKVGDVVLIDDNYGRLRALIDDRGNQVKSVGPAQAVRVMGLSGVPDAGAEFRVMVSEKRARELAEKFAEERKATELQQAQKAVNIDTLLDKLGEQSKKQLSIIVKADTQGTVEAIIDTLRDIRSEKITLEILGSSIGNVTANDVQRAAAGHAQIVGFQVNTEAGVAPIATHDGVKINTFRIIYELFDFVKQSLLDMLDPEYKEVVKGHAQIRQIFDIGKLGKVAGCQLLDGVVRKDARVRIKRLRDVLFEGKIASLKHFKDEVAEVRDMQEFGVSFVDFEDFAEGDVIECFAMEELERTL